MYFCAIRKEKKRLRRVSLCPNISNLVKKDAV